jgi:hypothetical protein
MSAAVSVSPLYPSQISRNGWFKQHNKFFPARAKLIQTLVQERIVQIIERETINTAVPARTRWISYDEFAAYCDCTIRAVEYAVSDLLKRGVIKLVQKAQGKGCSYSVPYEAWPELAAQSKIVPISEPAEEEPEPTAPPRRTVPVIENWRSISPGGRTKAVRLLNAVFQFRVRSHDGTLYRSQIVDDVLEVEVSNGAKEERSPQKTKLLKNSTPEGNGTNYVSENGFDKFEDCWLSRGINAGLNDWAEARKIWARLDIQERLSAVEGIRIRFEQGEYDDPSFIPLPQNYLANQSWMRPVRRRKKASSIDQKDAELKARYERGVQRIRERENKR